MNLSVLAFAVVVTAPGPKDPPKKAESETILGEWACVEAIGGGQMASAEELRHIGIDFPAEGKFRMLWGGQRTEGTYTTDPKNDPAEIDVVSDKNGKKALGIYKLEKDKLTLCTAETGGTRPTKFESPAGTRILLLTFTRVEKKKE
jgi:uncharacterized protein (TIGR03067 family)